jgi:hypothetical protein
MRGEASLARAIATQGQVWIGSEFRSEPSISYQHSPTPKVKFNKLVESISGRVGPLTRPYAGDVSIHGTWPFGMQCGRVSQVVRVN